MKFIKKVTFLAIFILLLSLSSNVFAVMSPTYPNKIRFTRGVSNTCYYVDSTASSYTSYVNSAANNWVNTGHGYNPIYMTAVSSNKGTHIDVYASSLSGSYKYTYAYTSFWTSSGTKLNSSGSTNYFYTEIMINKNLSQSTYVLIHEMGHCFGLAHNENKNSVMYKDDGGNARKVQACDNETINYLYK